MKTSKKTLFKKLFSSGNWKLLVLACVFAVNIPQMNGQFCGWNSNYDPLLQDPAYIDYIQEMLDATEVAANKIAGETELMTVEIPIVFHIVHKGTTVPNGDNISYDDVEDAFDRLNADFANTGISFCMAERDEFGNQLDDNPNNNIPEPGVVRVDASGIPEYMNSGISIGSQLEFDIKTLGPQFSNYSYLNVWVVSSILGENTNGQVQGVGYMPFTTAPEIDGVMMRHSIFNVSTNRVLTHEVGHYLGLFHTFQGDDSDFDGIEDTCPSATAAFPDSDEIGDTDPHKRSASGTCPTGDNLCNQTGSNPDTYSQLEDITNNHMDYSLESCRVNFTDGQVMHMLGTVDCHRKGLLNSLGCVAGCPLADIFYPDFTVTPENPIAHDDSGQNGEEATFEASSNLTEYQWYVDGVLQTVENGKLELIFNTPGDHIVCIRSEINDCEIETCKTVRAFVAGLCYDPVLEPCEILLNGDFEQNDISFPSSNVFHFYTPTGEFIFDKVCNWYNRSSDPAMNLNSFGEYVFYLKQNQEVESIATTNEIPFIVGKEYEISWEYTTGYSGTPPSIIPEFFIALGEDFPELLNYNKIYTENDLGFVHPNQDIFYIRDQEFISRSTSFTYLEGMGRHLIFDTENPDGGGGLWLKNISIKECNYCAAQPAFDVSEENCNEFFFDGLNQNPNAPGFTSWTIDGVTIPQFTGLEDVPFSFPFWDSYEVCMIITCPNGISNKHCKTITPSGLVGGIACEICQGPTQVDVEAQRCGDSSNELVVENFPITVPKGYGPCGTNTFFTDSNNGEVQLNDYYIDDSNMNEDIIYISFTYIADDMNAQLGANFAICSPDGIPAECFRFNVTNVNTCDVCSDDQTLVANFVVNCMDHDLTDDVFVYTGSFDFDPPFDNVEGCGVTSSSSGTSGTIGQSTDDGKTFPITFDISTNNEGSFNSQVTLCFYDEDNDKTYCYNVDINVINSCMPDPDGCEIDIPPYTIECTDFRDGNAIFLFSYALHLPGFIEDKYDYCMDPITGRHLISSSPTIELEPNVSIQVEPTIGANAYIFAVELAVPCEDLLLDPTTEIIIALCDENNNEVCADIDLNLICKDCDEGNKLRGQATKNDYMVYPNPAQNIFNIEAPSSEYQQVYTIYSPAGNIVMGGSLYKGKNIINLANVNPGLYLIRMQNGDEIKMKKVLIIK